MNKEGGDSANGISHNMGKSVRSQLLHGVLWNAIERFMLQGMTFVISVVLARLLMPSDFGLLGMLSVFLAILSSFVDGGFFNALVQKHSCSRIDFSTVFSINMLTSLALVVVLFFAAPHISEFFHEPILKPVTRVVSLSLILDAFVIVHRARLTIHVDFKSLAKVNVMTTLISGIVGISMAYLGYGVWSLVGQTLSRSFSSMLIFPLFTRWKPSIRFSSKSFKTLFGFGSKLLVTNIYSVVINNISTLFIGKNYSSKDLGYFTKANATPSTLSNIIYGVVGTVSFPVMSKVKDDKQHMLDIYKKTLFSTALLVFPLMSLCAVLSKSFILIFLTEKWLPCLTMMQLYCIARMFTPLSILNVNVLNASGRSDLFMWMDLSKAPLTLLILAITIPISVEAIVWGATIETVICFFINAYLPGRLFGYNAFHQLKDWRYIILSALLMSCIVVLYILLVDNIWLQFFGGGILGIGTYAFFCYLFGIIDYRSLYQKLKNKYVDGE